MSAIDLALLATVGMLLCLGWLLRIWWAIRPWKEDKPPAVVDDAAIHRAARPFSRPAVKGFRPGFTKTKDDLTVERLDAWRKSR